MYKKKITYEAMPFVNRNLAKLLENKYLDCIIHSQPNAIFIESSNTIHIKEINDLPNLSIEEWNKVGLFYKECYEKIENLIKNHDVINKEIIDKLSCLNINPKIITFDYDQIQCDFQLIKPLILSVLNDQLIFFTNDNKCLIICDEECNLDLQNLYNVLKGRLFDRFFALEWDLEKEIYYTEDQDLKDILQIITPDNMDNNKIKILSQYAYYDQFSKTVCEDLSLMGIVSSIKFKDNDLRKIHTKEECSHEVDLIRVAIALSKFKKYNLPQGHLDPFGLKKAADIVVNYALNYGIILPNFSEEILKLLNKRMKHFLSLSNSYMKYGKFLDWQNIHIHKNIKFNINDFLRIYNLYIKNTNKEQIHIDLTEHEIVLSKSLENIKYEEICQTISTITKYINENKISQFIERMKIIENFVLFVLKFFNINDLQNIKI